LKWLKLMALNLVFSREISILLMTVVTYSIDYWWNDMHYKWPFCLMTREEAISVVYYCDIDLLVLWNQYLLTVLCLSDDCGYYSNWWLVICVCGSQWRYIVFSSSIGYYSVWEMLLSINYCEKLLNVISDYSVVFFIILLWWYCVSIDYSHYLSSNHWYSCLACHATQCGCQ